LHIEKWRIKPNDSTRVSVQSEAAQGAPGPTQEEPQHTGEASWDQLLHALPLLTPTYNWLILVFGELLGKFLHLIFSCLLSPRALSIV